MIISSDQARSFFQVVADILPDDQVDKIKQMFHMMDTDQNGDLSFQELKDGLNKFGHYVPDPDVKLLMDAVSFHSASARVFSLSTDVF